MDEGGVKDEESGMEWRDSGGDKNGQHLVIGWRWSVNETMSRYDDVQGFDLHDWLVGQVFIEVGPPRFGQRDRDFGFECIHARYC